MNKNWISYFGCEIVKPKKKNKRKKPKYQNIFIFSLQNQIIHSLDHIVIRLQLV